MTNKKDLNKFFNDFLAKNPLFLNKKVLQDSYTPESIEHRDDQINTLAGILAPTLRLEKPSNVFVYGKTGTGKTLSVKYVTRKILDVANEKGLPLKVIYLNCKLKRIADTEYRLIAQIANEFGGNIPATGLPTDEVYKLFMKVIDNKSNKLIILVLDEIDQLVKKAGDGMLYNITRLNSELKNTEISLIGISNDLLFMDGIDPRVKSSLSEEEVLFHPYNALQIQDILRQRSNVSFRKEIIEEGVIEKCAAFAAREHGDARRALELLRVAGELAERSNKTTITLEDIDAAEEKIECDKVIDTIHSQPKQFQLTLYSLLSISEQKKKSIFTGDIYGVYHDLSIKIGSKPLTQRRVSDIIAELDMMGIINARVVSKGRYGRTREICLSIPTSTTNIIKNVIKESLNL